MKLSNLMLFIAIWTVQNPVAFAAQDQREKIHLEILGAVIGPTKINGKPWDGVTIKSNTKASSLISSMLNRGQAATAVISFVMNNAGQGFNAPDVVGFIQPIGPKPLASKYLKRLLRLATNSTMTRNSHTPYLSARYLHWTIWPTTRFRITLYDVDVNDHDLIGTVELTYGDIMKAVTNGKITYINVSSQSAGNQILYIKVSARRSTNLHAAPRAEGQ